MFPSEATVMLVLNVQNWKKRTKEELQGKVQGKADDPEKSIYVHVMFLDYLFWLVLFLFKKKNLINKQL